MNVAFLFKKTPTVFFLLLCIVISFNYAEAEIRFRTLKTISPRHISLAVRSGNGVYARRYAYGRPLMRYSTNGRIGGNRRYYNVGGRRRNLWRNYASRYQNWMPDYPGIRTRADKVVQQKKVKRLYPFLKEPTPKKTAPKKRRLRPQIIIPMQKPRPPKVQKVPKVQAVNEFDEDYFFPEEAKRAETKYEFETRFPRPKKKRRPEIEKPEFSKIPFYDEKPFKSKKREPAFSYSSFVQHPSVSLEGSEEIFEEPETFYTQPVVRTKKKRVKKKSNSRKKTKERYKPIVFEADNTEESYPPYDQYEMPTKTYKKRNKPNYEEPEDTDFIPNPVPVYTKPKPQVNSLFNPDADYRGSQKQHQVSQFSPSYPQTWSSVAETTSRPVPYQTDNGFQPQPYIPNQYNYKDYNSVPKPKPVPTNPQPQPTYYSQPDNNYKNVQFNDYNYIPTKQPPTHYNPYPSNAYSNQPTYSQPAPSSSPTLTDVTIQKSVPVYDNTETFYNFNNNAYANGHPSKYYNSDSGSKYYEPDGGYGTRLQGGNSYRNKLGEKTDSDNDFMKKHQNLYNNGLSGIPIQGDGYAKENGKKDYDIGYGDFQFDENPTN